MSFPSYLTVPLTSAMGAPQPTRRPVTRAKLLTASGRNPRMSFLVLCSEIGPEDFVAVHGSQCSPGRKRDAVRYKTDRAIAQSCVDAAGMFTAGGALLRTGRGDRHIGIAVGNRPVDDIGDWRIG